MIPVFSKQWRPRDENLGNRKLAVKFMDKAFSKGYAWQDALNDPEVQSLLKDPGIHRPSEVARPLTRFTSCREK